MMIGAIKGGVDSVTDTGSVTVDVSVYKSVLVFVAVSVAVAEIVSVTLHGTVAASALQPPVCGDWRRIRDAVQRNGKHSVKETVLGAVKVVVSSNAMTERQERGSLQGRCPTKV